MKSKLLVLTSLAAALGVIAVLALPALGAGVRTPASPGSEATSIPSPHVAPDEPNVAPAATSDEEDLQQASPAERESVLRQLQDVVDCARARGADVADPVTDEDGAIIPWSDGQPSDSANAALEECIEQRQP